MFKVVKIILNIPSKTKLIKWSENKGNCLLCKLKVYDFKPITKVMLAKVLDEIRKMNQSYNMVNKSKKSIW